MINKLKSIPESVKASVFFVVCNFLVKGISFITLPIFTRLLSTSEYGILTLYNSWLSIFTLFATLTLWGGVFNTGMVRQEQKHYEYISAVQSLGFIISICFFAVGEIFANPISKLIGINTFLTRCMFLEIVLVISYNVWMAAQRFEYKYKVLVIITIVTSILNPLLGYFLVTSTDAFKVESRVVSGLFFQFVLGIFFYIYNWYKGKIFFNKAVWKFVFWGNLTLIPHYLSTQILNQSDRIMIAKLCGEDKAGIYGVAYSFAMLLSLLSTGIESSFTPYVFQSIKNKKTERVKNITSLVTLLVGCVCLGLICIIPDVFKFMLPVSYHESIYSIPPVAMAAFFLFLYPVFGCIEFYYGKTKYVAITSCVFAVINLGLNYVFIRLFGYIAAAYTTFVCYFGVSIVHCFIMRHILRKNGGPEDLYNIKQIFIISGVFCLLALGLTVMYGNDYFRYIFLALLLIVCILKRNIFIKLIRTLITK